MILLMLSWGLQQGFHVVRATLVSTTGATTITAVCVAMDSAPCGWNRCYQVTEKISDIGVFTGAAIFVRNVATMGGGPGAVTADTTGDIKVCVIGVRTGVIMVLQLLHL